MQEQGVGPRRQVATFCGSSRFCNCLYAIFQCCWCRERIVLLLLGLDNAGKSTLLATIREENPETVVPTWGFDEQVWDTRQFRASIYDLGGGKSIRGIWPHYYAEAYGAIFVIDGADEDRLSEAAKELKTALNHPRLAGKPILIVANKQNLPTALPLRSLLAAVGAIDVKEQALVICDCRLQDGYGLDKELQLGLDWLLVTIKLRFEDLQERVTLETAIQKEKDRKSISERGDRVKSFRAEKEAAAAATATQSHPIMLSNLKDLESETHARMQAWIGPADSEPVTCTYERVIGRGKSLKVTDAEFGYSMEPLIQQYEDTSDEPGYSPAEIADYFGEASVNDSSAEVPPNLPGQPHATGSLV